MSTNELLNEKEKQNNILVNTKYILLYSLSFAAAMGFNDLILSIFDTFSGSKHIIPKSIYVVTMFIVTLWVAYYLGDVITHT